MNHYQTAIERIATMDHHEADVLKVLSDTRDARQQVRSRQEHDSNLLKLPYASRPNFLGEQWKI